MSDTVIKVENLSKSYTISHQNGERYTALRDVLTNGVKDMSNRLMGRANGHVDTSREEFWALNNVSFEVKQGERVGIIGRNGAGKSTLLKILSRITEPTKGRIHIKGRVASLLEVGTGFHPELTGRENIYLNGAILGMRRDEIRRKFDEIVAFAEVEKFLDTPVKRYSSGMYVRLAFAVAAHLEPEILVVDEVLAVGDAQFQKKCLGKMGNVADEGRTVLFVSHNMVAMQSLCEKIVWLSHGKIVEEGRSFKVISNYLQVSGTDTAAMESKWDDSNPAPGNDIVRLRRICVRPTNDDPSNTLTMQTPFVIEIEYENLLPNAHLHTTLHIYTEQGIVAFTTGNGLEAMEQGRSLSVGLYRNICSIPANLLNSGRHYILLLIVKDSSSVILQFKDIVSFDIIDSADRNGAWYGKEPGVVQPLLRWTTAKINSPSAVVATEDGEL